ncbi:MAG: hypothetical protein KDC77_05910 [Cyclobacteriaceae bacterium]|nr:hypothetical protein [Cyclobacteriaceae bacterium]MCB9238399.1 hypothetical protein [Flammeovirgaceae bacterium]
MGRFFILLFWVVVNGCNNQDKSNQKPISNEIIIDWNGMAYQVAYEHDQFYSLIGVRAFVSSPFLGQL